MLGGPGLRRQRDVPARGRRLPGAGAEGPHQAGQAALGLQRPVDAGDQLGRRRPGRGDDVGGAGPRVGTQRARRRRRAPVQRDAEGLLPRRADTGPDVDGHVLGAGRPGGVGDEVEAAVEDHRARAAGEEVGVGRGGVRAVGVAVEAEGLLAEPLAQEVEVAGGVRRREVPQALAGARQARSARLGGRGPERRGARGPDGRGHPVGAEGVARDRRGRPGAPRVDREDVEPRAQPVEAPREAPQARGRRRAGPAVVHHQRPDPRRGVGGRQPHRGQVDRLAGGLPVVQRDRHRGALERPAAGAPGGGRGRRRVRAHRWSGGGVRRRPGARDRGQQDGRGEHHPGSHRIIMGGITPCGRRCPTTPTRVRAGCTGRAGRRRSRGRSPPGRGGAAAA